MGTGSISTALLPIIFPSFLQFAQPCHEAVVRLDPIEESWVNESGEYSR